MFEAIMSRRSVRKYKPMGIEEVRLMRVLEAERLAPSAANRQPWHFVIVTEPKTKERFRTENPSKKQYTLSTGRINAIGRQE
ncbi:MAG: nitroreductase family protein [Nitrososphaerales archaeon]